MSNGTSYVLQYIYIVFNLSILRINIEFRILSILFLNLAHFLIKQN